jgi:hypothetical protein
MIRVSHFSFKSAVRFVRGRKLPKNQKKSKITVKKSF